MPCDKTRPQDILYLLYLSVCQSVCPHHSFETAHSPALKIGTLDRNQDTIKIAQNLDTHFCSDGYHALTTLRRWLKFGT